MSLCLGIDTSNYTTSLALADETGVLENKKMLLPVKEGEAGLRQSNALFAHICQLPILFEQLGNRKIDAVGYSARPRDLEGSYMPCFLAGQAVARSIAALLGVPIFDFSHQAGHIAAAAYSADRMEWLDQRFLAFHVSGGTTDLLLVEGEKITGIGTSSDLHAGQAVDRVGLLLGLRFPCGPALEQLSGQEPFPKCKVSVKGLNCSLSGVENQAKQRLQAGQTPAEIAAFTLAFLTKSLEKMCQNTREIYPALPILFAGGVMSNRRIQDALSRLGNVAFASPAFSADNAAGVALLCRKRMENKEIANGENYVTTTDIDGNPGQ